MDPKRNFLDSLREALSGFGLNEAELTIYASLLQLGNRQASIIAKTAGLNRAYTYDLLASLKTKGLVQEGMRNKVRHFCCTPPEHLLHLVEEREKSLERQKRALEGAIPKLLELQGRASLKKEQICWYQGADTPNVLLATEFSKTNEQLCIFRSGALLADSQLVEFIDAHRAVNAQSRIRVLSLSKRDLPICPSVEQKSLAVAALKIDAVIGDHVVLLFTPPPRALSLVLRDSAFQQAGEALFESAWSQRKGWQSAPQLASSNIKKDFDA